jgi:hypothetical protein
MDSDHPHKDMWRKKVASVLHRNAFCACATYRGTPHNSLAPPLGSIRFKQAQVHSAPSSLVSSQVVSHSWSGGTPSQSRAFPLSALSLGCYSRFQRHAQATMQPSALPISVFPLNGGARRLPSSVPSPSVVPPGRACRLVRNPASREVVLRRSHPNPQPPIGAAATSR